MIIERIHVDRFGALDGVTVDDLGAGVEVLHGTNETGKTSILEFIRGVLFGFGHLFRRGTLDPHVSCGGRLQARAGLDGRRIVVQRRHEGPHLARLSREDYLGERDLPVADQLSVTAADGTSTALFLQDYVGEIDERTFTAVMAFGLDELHELRTLEAEGCGSRLYELACGLDRGRVTRVLDNLRDAVARLDSPDPEVSAIEALRRRRSAALSRLAAAGAPAVAAGALGAELARIDAEILALEEALARARHTEETIRSALPLEPLFHAWKKAAAALAEIEATPLLHPDLDAWHLAAKRRDGYARLAAKRKRIRAKLARELAGRAADETIWRKRAAVAALCEEQPRLERLTAEAARAAAAARQASRRFGEQLGQAGIVRLLGAGTGAGASVDTLSQMELPAGFARSLGGMRSRARALAAASRTVRDARRAEAEVRGALDAAKAGLKAAPAAGATTLAAAIEEAAGRAALVRNRIAAGEHVTELDRALAALDRDVAAHLKGQLIPMEWLLGLGAVFVTGAAMILSGLLLPAMVTGGLAYALAALGLVGTGLASVVTWTLDRSASERLEAARRQVTMARKQRDDASAQCALLDKRLDSFRSASERWPGEHAPALERRLAAALAEVERLEGLAAREGSIHLLADRVEAARQDLARALEARSAARGAWKRALEGRALPATLSPLDVRRLARHRAALVALDEERRRTSEDARLRQEELAAAGQRVEEVMVECDMLPEGSPLDQLAQLRERLERETSFHRLRGRMTARLERARRRHREALARVKLAEKRVREIVARWGVETEQEFLPLVDRRPAAEEARQRCVAAERAWIEARRPIAELADLEDWLAATRPVTLEQRLAEAHLGTLAAREALDRCRDARAAAAEAVGAAARDHSTEGLQAEIAAVEHDLDAQLRRRGMLDSARGMLEAAREAFARDHQPAVLREASRWLDRLTEGHYDRITTSIHEARLEIHDRTGMVWNPDRLSRGTREQAFLALRLALVRDLERHGVHLPVVIDDALVNFDDARARAAARALVDFVADQPRERQMIVLTCHAHVAAIFRDVGARVRTLFDTEIPVATARIAVFEPVQPAPPPAEPAPRPRVVVHHLAPAPAAPLPAPPPAAAWTAPVEPVPVRHSRGGLGYPRAAGPRLPHPTVIHSGHLAGLGYVGIVSPPSAAQHGATPPTPVGTTAVTAAPSGRPSRPLVERVAGVSGPGEGDGGPAPLSEEPAAPPSTKARAPRRPRGRAD
ncbi:MAG: AAA family ATPase [Planctomycetaceae bacterium]